MNPMTRIVRDRPAPNAAATTIISTSDGKHMIASVARIKTWSSQPP